MLLGGVSSPIYMCVCARRLTHEHFHLKWHSKKKCYNDMIQCREINVFFVRAIFNTNENLWTLHIP